MLQRSALSLRSTLRHVHRYASLSQTSIPDAQIAQLASRPLHQLNLSDLVKHGEPPLSTPSLLASANFTSSLIPIRLAHRIRALRNLPFIVVSNPHISRIYGNYLHSLETLQPFQDGHISNLEEETRFTDALADLVQTHANTIPVLARGFLECRNYIPPQAVTSFLEEHLRARIGTRLIAEQHIALHLSSVPHNERKHNHSSSYIGVIDTALRPASVLSHCEAFVSDLCEFKYGVRPRLTIDGAPGTTIAHIPTHLEYILTELLKNAFRATIESGNEREPVEATIAISPGRSYIDGRNAVDPLLRGEDGFVDSEEAADTETLTIRIRDRGGGIAPEHMPHIWAYSFTTFSEEDAALRAALASSTSPTNSSSNGLAATATTIPATSSSPSSASLPFDGQSRPESPASFGTAAAPSYSHVDALAAIVASGGGQGSGSIAGLGYGLPLSRAYAGYFGGSIRVQSLWGWGTDVYLTLKGLRGF